MTARRKREDHRYLPVTVLLLIALTALVFAPLRRAAYVRGDHTVVERNPVVVRGDLAEIFSGSHREGARGNDRNLYRPVTILSYALERRAVGRPDPLLSHAVNVILHVGVSLLLLALARRLGMTWFGSSVAALLFAVHPVHAEPVANAAGRAEILAALFTLAALVAQTHTGPWRGADAGPVASRLAAWAGGAMVFLALASKESAVALPVLLVSLEVLFRPPPWKRLRGWLVDRGAALAPAALGTAVYLMLRTRALEAFPAMPAVRAMDNFLVTLSPLERIPTALSVVGRAARLLIFPVGLTTDYSGYVIPLQRTLLAPAPLLGLLLLGLWVLLGLAPWLWRTGGGDTRRLVGFAMHLFLLPYVVTSNLPFLVGAIFAERSLYLPSAGFCLLLGITFRLLATSYPAFPRWTEAERLRMVGWIPLILLAAFSLLTWQRSTEWRNDETIFLAATRIHPNGPRAQLVVGGLLAKRGRADEAMFHFDRALDAWPECAAAWFEKGVILERRGDLAGAERAFRNTIRLRPSHALAYVRLGATLRRLGRLQEGERAYRKGLLREPEPERRCAGPGHAFHGPGRRGETANAYRHTVALGRPNSSGVRRPGFAISSASG